MRCVANHVWCTREPTVEVSKADRLIKAARAGDRSALGTLYEAHGAALYRVAFRLTESWPDAQDVVQQVFLGLPEALRTYEGRGSFEGWLVQLTTRTALMKLRRRRQRREVSFGLIAWLVERTEPVRGIDRLEVDQALSHLPDEQRTVFVLKIIEGYTHDEIGEMLGISNGASRARLFRAIKSLRRALS